MPQYSTFQPKPYRPRMSPYWYLERWPYLRFMVRELSCVCVAYFAIVMLLQIYAISHGPDAYAYFQAWMRLPVILILNAIALVLIVFHAITWFALVPRVFVRHVMGPEIPDAVAMIPNYGAWFVASAVVAAFILRLF
jgi:fumarate reductase subunit C